MEEIRTENKDDINKMIHAIKILNNDNNNNNKNIDTKLLNMNYLI